MKKTFLRSAAIAMAVTGASAAHAVHVNPDGLGQVLLYPYYTVQNDFVTAIHIVNTTNQAKAVKVRFLEGKNSQEVLDFNLYLSPHDVWAGEIVPDATAGAKLVSSDTSCIAPKQLATGGQPFRNSQFKTDPNASDPNRRAEGYVEVIEMGTLYDPDQIKAVTHVNGTPFSCATITAADTSQDVAVSSPTGDLFGTGHLVSVDGGVRTSYDAVALDAFSNQPIWHRAGDTAPSLNDVSPAQAELFDGNNAVIYTSDNGRNIDAVSATLMQASIVNQFTIDPGRLSQTDWVITFPTKRFYVNSSLPTPNPLPFQNPWVAKNPQTGAAVLKACHDVEFEYYDREELPHNGADFSPMDDGIALCNEVNTLSLTHGGSSTLFGAVSTAATLGIDSGTDAGWMRVGFATDYGTGVGLLSGFFYYPGYDQGYYSSLEGLPVIGFSASRNVNQVDVEIDGLTVYSAVMGSNAHKGEQSFNYN